jgi:CHAD domain-containing protein/inorganic triphosphatase YgiF
MTNIEIKRKISLCKRGRGRMEIESKFLVTNEEDFQALESLSELASYVLSDAEVQIIEDTYLDTQDKSIMVAGYFLRVRKIQGELGSLVTIKSLGGFEDGEYKREEYNSSLPEEASIFECSNIRIIKMILQFTAGFELFPHLSLNQKRIVRKVKSGKKTIAETSLDSVILKKESREKSYKEFEVELKDEGTSDDLRKIRDFLHKHLNLSEDPLSKFERAILFMENLPEKKFLSIRERAFCEQLKEQKDIFGKQAKILLALDKGQTSDELSLLLGISINEIESLRSNFENERLSVFPFTFDEDKNPKFYFQFTGCVSEKEKKSKDLKERDPENLLDYYKADKHRAKKVRESALKLFEGLFTYQDMEEEDKKLLGLAAFLKEIGNSTLPEAKNLMSREILLAHPIKGLKMYEMLMLALIIKLQNPVVSDKNVISTLRNSQTKLPPALQNKALMLASLMRVANLFEFPIEARPGIVRQHGDDFEIEVIGIDLDKDSKKAKRKSKLWKSLFGRNLQFTQAPDDEKIRNENEFFTEKELKKEKKPGKKKCKKPDKLIVKPTDPMGWFGHRVLCSQFSCMLSHEKGTIKGEDIEDLHDMRVEVRRMRAASKVFEAYLDSEKLEPHLKELKRTLKSLGKVRDLDVFREKAKKYLKTLPSGHEHDLDPLFIVLSEEREKARENLNDYLDSGKYNRFKNDFSDTLSSPETLILPTTSEKCDALPYRIMDVLPSILYAHLADVDAYSEWVDGLFIPVDRMHRLRIAAKGFRYTLEFFESVLGDDAKIMIDELTNLQDHQGDLHDAIVDIDLLNSFLKTGKWGSNENGRTSEKEDFSEGMEGVEAYLKYKEEELKNLLDTFPEVWGQIRNREFREKIERNVKRLLEISL